MRINNQSFIASTVAGANVLVNDLSKMV